MFYNQELTPHLPISTNLATPPADLLSHNPDHLITKIAPVKYDPMAQCPTWDSFLDRVFDGDASLIDYARRITGYSLTGDTSEQVIFILQGLGANGKTTFLRTIQNLMGDYSQQVPSETLLGQRNGRIPNDIARLKGARFAVSSEIEAGSRMSEALVKQLTGGDKVAARFLHKEYFEFLTSCKIFLSANSLPKIEGVDHAIWRRIRLVPFSVTIPEADQDGRLPERLEQESAGILAWMVRGCLEWQRNGLGEPRAVIDAGVRYRDGMDELGGFIRNRCQLGQGETAWARELYGAYQDWSRCNEEAAVSQTKFGRSLRQRGLNNRSSTGGRSRWVGIGLSEVGDPSDPSDPLE